MTIALLFGTKSMSVRNNMLQLRDDIQIDTYQSVEDLITGSKTRNKLYDRVIILSKILADNNNATQNLNNLFDYWSSFCPNTEFVLFARKNVDDALSSQFLGVMCSPVCVSVLVQNSTTVVLEALIALSIKELAQQYGCSMADSKIELETDTYVVEEPKPSIVSTKQSVKSKKSGKVGLFNKLFSKKGTQVKTTENMGTNSENQEIAVETEVTAPVDDESYNPTSNDEETVSSESYENYSEEVSDETETIEEVYDTSGQEGYESIPESENSEISYDDSSLHDSEKEEDFSAENCEESLFSSENITEEDLNFNDNSSEFDDSLEEGTLNDAEILSDDSEESEVLDLSDISSNMNEFETELDTDVEGDNEVSCNGAKDLDTSDINNSDACAMSYEEVLSEGLITEDDIPSNEPKGTPSEEDIVPIEGKNLVSDSEVTNNTVKKSGKRSVLKGLFKKTSASGTVPSPKVSIAPESGIIEEDITEVPTEEVVDTNKVKAMPVTSAIPSAVSLDSNSDVVEDDLLSDISVAELDNAYKKNEEASNVRVERVEIVREVVKEIPTSGSSKKVLNSLLAGKGNRVFLVTGDRGTGSTTFALDLARTLAKHVSVLYYDGDTINHGLLNYLDYNRVCEYDKQQLQGSKLVKSVKAFNNCAMRYDNNLDFVLSNFDVEVSDDEYETVQSVVADIANDYNVVIADIPFSKLHLCQELIYCSTSILVTEKSKRGLVNLAYSFDKLDLPIRIKRKITSTGTLLLTKGDSRVDTKKLKDYISSIFSFEESDVNWLNMKTLDREKINSKFLQEIIE